jgi:two-component system sensor histidine kinase and response regulator WspE
MPIVMVSYKDREEDRRAGLEAGATAYLTKAAFHDRTLLDTVADLIASAAQGT